ncbi:RecF/RecN/SMC [Daldinia grandis]|nr:RecF/RecN/SMC [Daldinia grandis]
MGKLIRLELFNFKSYKGHHTLLFGDSYFTSIIGPNGSGKSNSMDAISFVLGIKSSHLRSAHLKDLVYRGRVLKTSKINDDGSAAQPTTNGHTNGHVNGDDDDDKPNRSDPKTAWVMAVYEDDAGDEQRWKRSITNQGSSEYRINDRVVTAQQYNEALEAENILIKARNFLVFQGDVEAIAAQSPQDLTRLIEQISGSLEYKAEYERLQNEADQAAENSNFQLQRRRGINSEIKQYQEQKREAENFEKKTEERDAAIVTHILWKLYHFQQVMDDSSAKIQDHQENLKEFRRNVESFERKLEAARKEQADAAKEVHRVERQIKRQEKEIEEKENSLVPIEEKVQQTSSQAETIRNRIEVRKLLEADDGRRQNDKEARIKEMVTSLKRIYPGVKGRVGELCKPKQKKFDEAVITALGRDFDSIIVDSEKTGVECVQYLKDQRFPPMTFIPLDNIKVSAVNTAVKGISGARLTIDAIDFDSSLERAMSYACGGSIVCDTLDIAKHVCYERRIQVKAVTLEGFVIHKAGLMTGGRVQDNKGNKRRFEEHDVQNLQKMADKFRDEIEKIPRADRRGAAEESLQNELAGLDQRLAFANSELAAFNQNLASKKKELEHVKRQLKEWQPKFKDEDNNLQKTRASVEKFKSAIAEVEDKIFADFCKRLGYSDIRAYEAQQGSLEQEADEKRTQFDLQRSRLESNKSWETSRYKDTESRLHNLEVRLKQLSEDIKSYRAEKKAIEEAMSNDQDNLEALQEQLDEYKAELTKRTEKVNAAKAEVQKRSKDIESRQKAISALETEVQKNSAGKFALLRRCRLEQINIPLISGSLDNLPNEDNLLHQDPDAMDVDDGEDAEMMDNAMNDHGIEVDFDQLDDDLKNPDDEGIEEKLQDKILSLTAELEKLNPNMRAIERLEVVETRLKATERDYNESKAAFEAAKDAFDEIKARRFELFNKAFVHIREQIEHVYKDLTRSEQYPLGGQAYLDIEEDTDRPYLSGIKYHAMPPLKRFRDMEHLSGGEKTMAALALLFAIHSYQPSPFFVLDEVDAALDNANVDKIKNYIREHAGPGMQFIVISLKTGLFQDSESLVGVYRDQEVNSSRTLTLDLRKYV